MKVTCTKYQKVVVYTILEVFTCVISIQHFKKKPCPYWKFTVVTVRRNSMHFFFHLQKKKISHTFTL